MRRDLWLPTFGVAFMLIAIMVLIGVCAKAPSVDQSPLPTRTPTVEPTYTPAATVTGFVIVPTLASGSVSSTSTEVPKQEPPSTLTPLPTATATQERRASEWNTPQPTATKPAPPVQVPAPYQLPRQP